jgi:predicted nucleotidyltransferase
MKETLEKFSKDLQHILGGNLRSFILYGSAAAGDLYKTSDYNTLIILNDPDTASLKNISGPVKKWVKKGNPPPLVFTYDRFLKSDDIYPIEFLDMKDHNKVLAGEDVLKKMKIKSGNLRLEIERELKSKLIRLRQAYLMTGGKPAEVKKLMRDSVSTFIILFKAILRLYGKKVPAKKSEVIGVTSKLLKLNGLLFAEILTLKEGRDAFGNGEAEARFGAYMDEIEKVNALIDKFKKK